MQAIGDGKPNQATKQDTIIIGIFMNTATVFGFGYTLFIWKRKSRVAVPTSQHNRSNNNEYAVTH